MKLNIIEKAIKYIAEREVERLKRKKTGANQSIPEEMEKRKELHYMRCPKCSVRLEEIEHKAIKIDKCPQCDGTWLEAEKLETALQNEKTIVENIYRTFMKQLGYLS